MTNSERFDELLNEYFNENNKYFNEINNFKSFLKSRIIYDKVFNLTEVSIDDYFSYSLVEKIGAITTLTTHVSALKSLFDFLIRKGIDFKKLYAYIDTDDYKRKLEERLSIGESKSIFDEALLNSILFRMDKYISENISNDQAGKAFINVLIARLYAKLTLLIPLKPSQMLYLKFDDNFFRAITYNDITIKIPNSLWNNIMETKKYFEEKYGTIYKNDCSIFEFVFKSIDKNLNTSSITEIFTSCYKELDMRKLLKKRDVGKKKYSVYTVESYKKTAINQMLNNGTNIVFLKQLTGLDFKRLMFDDNYGKYNNKEDLISVELNNGVFNTSYYIYL